jgi:hypothetical protein
LLFKKSRKKVKKFAKFILFNPASSVSFGLCRGSR